MGKKAVQKEVSSSSQEEVRRKLTGSEKRKLYIAALLSLFMLIAMYFLIRNIFVASYDSKLGGLWQAKRIVLEKTDSPLQDQVAIELLTKDMKEGPETSYRILEKEDPVRTDSGEQRIPELGSYKVELLVDDLTLFPEVEAGLEGIIEIPKEEDNEGILKRMQGFVLENGQTAFYFGFDEKPQISLFESTKDVVRIQFVPVGFTS